MSDSERVRKTKNYEDQRTVPSKIGLSDITIGMDIKEETKIDIPNHELDESQVLSCLHTDIIPTAKDKQVYEKASDKNDKLKEQNVDDNQENIKNIDIPTIMTIRVYDTYFGNQIPREIPQQRQPLARPSMHQQYPPQWGTGEYTTVEPLTYDPRTRNSFVKFVFSIVLIMLIVTSCFVAYVVATNTVKHYMRRNWLIFIIVAMVLLLGCHYSLFLSPCTRVPPCNIIVLAVAVVAYCILAGILTSRYKTDIILYAVLATTAVVLGCLMLACTKFDFTSWILYVIGIAIVFGAISITIFVASLITGSYPKPLHIAVLIIGSLIQVVILIIELQMILGGKSVELNEDDYALGAFMLYTSIMTLFMNLLQLIGYAN